MAEKEKRESLTYRDSGVDIDAKERGFELIKPLLRSTYSPQVLSELGAFGSLFSFPTEEYRDPVLVSSVDGVGTKIKVAIMMNRHDTVGQDLVAHCANDLLVQGAKSLFFLDYLATGKLQPEMMAEVVKGLAIGCQQIGCALIGGETAEMPGFYAEGDYDLVGFIIGVVEKDRIVTGANIKPGDVLLGLASNGLHTNGYSLVRKLFFEIAGKKVSDTLPGLEGNLGEELLRIHRCYAPSVLPLLSEFQIKGMAHITGGGMVDNLRRTLPQGCRAVIQRGTWETPKIFQIIQDMGKVPESDMFRTFNLGVGFILVVPSEQSEGITSRLSETGETVYQIGEIESGQREVVIS